MERNEKEKFIVIDREELAVLKSLNLLGQGFSGIGYQLNDEEVFKLLLNDMIDISDLKYFTTIENESFTFPRFLVFLDNINPNSLVGYTMKYHRGNDFRKLDPDINMDELLKACEIVEGDIREVTIKNGVYLEDINPSNVIYTPDKEVKVIDTDLSFYFPSETEYELYKHGMYEWGNFLLCMLAKDYPYKNERINQLYEDCIFSGSVKPTRIINYLREEIVNETGTNPESLGEYQEALQLVRRK